MYACVCLCVYACRRTVTKRTFGQTGLVIHTWYASHSLIKTIWVMAISQHQFYLNRKQSKVSQHTHMTDEVCSGRLHIYTYIYIRTVGSYGLRFKIQINKVTSCVTPLQSYETCLVLNNSRSTPTVFWQRRGVCVS